MRHTLVRILVDAKRRGRPIAIHPKDVRTVHDSLMRAFRKPEIKRVIGDDCSCYTAWFDDWHWRQSRDLLEYLADVTKEEGAPTPTSSIKRQFDTGQAVLVLIASCRNVGRRPDELEVIKRICSGLAHKCTRIVLISNDQDGKDLAKDGFSVLVEQADPRTLTRNQRALLPISFLPPVPEEPFLGREDSVSVLCNSFVNLSNRRRTTNRRYVIRGPHFTGKSRLAWAVSHAEAIARAFPDGRLWFDLGPDLRLSRLRYRLKTLDGQIAAQELASSKNWDQFSYSLRRLLQGRQVFLGIG